MRPRSRWLTAALVIAALLLVSACSQVSGGGGGEQPARVEPVAGTDLSRVILTEKAAERLDIQTAAVQTAKPVTRLTSSQPTVIPQAAVIYDKNGVTWVYTSPEHLVFVRHRISVDHMEAGSAILLDGPPPGTQVVTVGVAELYGTEYGVGE